MHIYTRKPMSSSIASSSTQFEISAKGNGEQKDGPAHEVVDPNSSSQTQLEDSERKARVDAVWKQMNKGANMKTLKSISNKPTTTINRTTPKSCSQKNSANWMTYLGIGPKKIENPLPDKKEKQASNGISDEAKKLAGAAMSAVRDASAAAASGKGKIEIKEVRDFAGQDIEIKKLVDADSEKAKAASGPSSAVDAVLEQIKKKQKLSVLDKTKKDWGEYKEENKIEEELETYKKSSNKYLDKVSFLERSDYREFERERDARLALQSKRKTDMSEDD